MLRRPDYLRRAAAFPVTILARASLPAGLAIDLPGKRPDVTIRLLNRREIFIPREPGPAVEFLEKASRQPSAFLRFFRELPDRALPELKDLDLARKQIDRRLPINYNFVPL